MSAVNKLELLRVLGDHGVVGEARQFSFHSLAKSLTFPIGIVGRLLNELEEDHFINRYTLSGLQGFLVAITQKGMDAVKDESFI